MQRIDLEAWWKWPLYGISVSLVVKFYCNQLKNELQRKYENSSGLESSVSMVSQVTQVSSGRGTQMVIIQWFCLSRVKTWQNARTPGWRRLIMLPWNSSARLCFLEPILRYGIFSDSVTLGIILLYCPWSLCIHE